MNSHPHCRVSVNIKVKIPTLRNPFVHGFIIPTCYLCSHTRICICVCEDAVYKHYSTVVKPNVTIMYIVIVHKYLGFAPLFILELVF